MINYENGNYVDKNNGFKFFNEWWVKLLIRVIKIYFICD